MARTVGGSLPPVRATLIRAACCRRLTAAAAEEHVRPLLGVVPRAYKRFVKHFWRHEGRARG